MDSVVALDHLAEDSGHRVILYSTTHRIGYNTSLFSQDPSLRSQGGVVLDPGAHPLAGILVGDLPWEDLEDPGDQDPDQWVQGGLEGQGIGVRLMEDLEVQGVQEGQEVGIRAEREVSKVTLRRSQERVRVQQKVLRKSRKTCLTSAERCGWRLQRRGGRCITTMPPPGPPSGPSPRGPT